MKTVLLILICIAFIKNEAVSQQNYIDVVYLKNGSVIKGIIIEQIPNETVRIKTLDGSSEMVCKMDDIQKITKELSMADTEQSKVRENYKPQQSNPDDNIRYKPEELKLKKPQIGFYDGGKYMGIVGAYWGDAEAPVFMFNFYKGIGDLVSVGLNTYLALAEGFTVYGALAEVGFHFMPNKNLDPFVKGEIGYGTASTKYSTKSYVGFSWGVQGGINYFFSRSVALTIAGGAPFYGRGGLTFCF